MRSTCSITARPPRARTRRWCVPALLAAHSAPPCCEAAAASERREAVSRRNASGGGGPGSGGGGGRRRLHRAASAGPNLALARTALSPHICRRLTRSTVVWSQCYYMGVGDKESGTAGGVKRDISGSLARGVNAKRLCNRMKKKDAQMCELRYEKKIDVKNTDLKCSRRVKESCGLLCWARPPPRLAPPAACLASSGTGACPRRPGRRRLAPGRPSHASSALAGAPWREPASSVQRHSHVVSTPRPRLAIAGSCVSRS